MANNLTVTYKGNTIHTASASGSATLETGGTWCEDDIGLSYEFDEAIAILAVTVTNGTATSVTATKSGVSVSLTYSGGIWSAELPSFGTWTVMATDGTHANSATVNASTAGLYSVSIYMPDVPSGYTQLEYVEGSVSNSAIETTIYPTDNNRMVVETACVSIPSSGTLNAFIYAYSSSPKLNANLALAKNYNGVTNRWRYHSLNNASGGSVSFGTLDSQKHIFNAKGNTCIYDGVSYTISSYTAVTTNSTAFLVVRFRQDDFVQRYWRIQLYNPADTALIADFVGAVRKSDSVVGMYDVTNSKFYVPNNTIIAGPAV